MYIRVATIEDAKELLAIYAPYVCETAISFEYEVPSVNEFENRIKNIQTNYPYLLACENGELIGYAYATRFHARAAYDWSVETTIYVAKTHRGKGVGRKLYEALERALRLQNIVALEACIAYPEEDDAYLTKNSIYFHAHMGFEQVGDFKKSGFKFGNWYNIVWMEKVIGEHAENPKPLLPFPQIQSAWEEEQILKG